MKKALSTLLMTLTLVTILFACKKNDDGDSTANTGGAMAATPTPQACGVPGSTCTTQNNYYYQNAPQFMDYQWSNNGFCGCPPNYSPVMNPQWGISCAPNNWIQNFNIGYQAYYSFNFQSAQSFYGSQNGQWSSIPQVTYSPAVARYEGGICYNQAASVCDTRIPNSCPNGGSCRTTAGGSYIGLCAGQGGSAQYGYPQPQIYCYTNYYGQRDCSYSPYGNAFKPGGNPTDSRIPR